jgi:hypothetical protein
VTSFFASSDTQTPPSIIHDAAQGGTSVTSRLPVGHVPHDTIAAEEKLDAEIAKCGDEMVAAMKAGDRQAAEAAQDRMYAAISSRSPEHQQRLSARAWQRMLDNDPCYFSAAGEAARAAMERKTA